MTITLDPKLEAILSELGRKQGVDPEVLALNALRERFVTVPEPRDEWERRLLQAASHCGVVLSDEAISSEGIYD
ncbi:MAG: hypothetical protein K2R98_16205 [Gemmataceae bacterium]|nr:hypothetical protein [Gemmataceae bacterium]